MDKVWFICMLRRRAWGGEQGRLWCWTLIADERCRGDRCLSCRSCSKPSSLSSSVATSSAAIPILSRRVRALWEEGGGGGGGGGGGKEGGEERSIWLVFTAIDLCCNEAGWQHSGSLLSTSSRVTSATTTKCSPRWTRAATRSGMSSSYLLTHAPKPGCVLI